MIPSLEKLTVNKIVECYFKDPNSKLIKPPIVGIRKLIYKTIIEELEKRYFQFPKRPKSRTYQLGKKFLIDNLLNEIKQIKIDPNNNYVIIWISKKPMIILGYLFVELFNDLKLI